MSLLFTKVGFSTWLPFFIYWGYTFSVGICSLVLGGSASVCPFLLLSFTTYFPPSCCFCPGVMKWMKRTNPGRGGKLHSILHPSVPSLCILQLDQLTSALPHWRFSSWWNKSFAGLRALVKAGEEFGQFSPHFSAKKIVLRSLCRNDFLGVFAELSFLLWLVYTSVNCLLDRTGCSVSQKSLISEILSRRRVWERGKLTFYQDRTCLKINPFASAGSHKVVIKCIFKAKTKKA